MEENKVKNKIAQTYAEDMARALETGGGGMIKKIIHEQEEQEAEKKNLSPESKKNRTFMFASILLVALALGALFFIIVFRQQIFTVSVEPQFRPIIFTDQNQFLEVGGLAKDKIAQTVLNAVNAAKVKTGGAEGIYLTENKKVLGFRKFLNLIKVNLDQNQIAFMSDNFLMGAVDKNLFILLKTRSIADIFGGMRAWEAKMFFDLRGFFGIDITADTNYFLTKDFTDGFIANKNARILYGQDGKIAMMYVFADDTSVLIANREETVREISLRLSSGQIRK